jgi:hypothetical protein
MNPAPAAAERNTNDAVDKIKTYLELSHIFISLMILLGA